jgi:ornithine cyclodeaminase
MLGLTDEDVERVLAGTSVTRDLRDAFIDLAEGAAAQQLGMRTDAGGAKLSTLGAVVPRQGVLGAKVYSTIDGRFNFLIVLVSATTGLPLAMLASSTTGSSTAQPNRWRRRSAFCSTKKCDRLASVSVSATPTVHSHASDSLRFSRMIRNTGTCHRYKP